MRLFQSPNEEIRIRVVPNSNDNSDILMKNEVIDIVIDYVYYRYNSNEEILVKSIENDLDILNNQLTQYYNATAKFEMHTFINKTYNESNEINGEYLTLLVEIGDGLGDNWWGSIYPGFLEKSSSEEVVYKSYILEKIKEGF